MARTKEITLATSGATSWVPLDYNITPFSVGFSVYKTGTGDITYSVQHTHANVLADSSVAAGAIFDHSTVSGKTGAIDGNYIVPITAIRMNATAVSGNGQATLKLLVTQAGTR